MLQEARTLTSRARFSRSEWAVNQHRDSLALYVGFDSLAQYISIAENESIGRVKFNALQVRVALMPPLRSCAVSHAFALRGAAENDTTMRPSATQRRRLTRPAPIGGGVRSCVPAEARAIDRRPLAAARALMRALAHWACVVE